MPYTSYRETIGEYSSVHGMNREERLRKRVEKVDFVLADKIAVYRCVRLGKPTLKFYLEFYSKTKATV